MTVSQKKIVEPFTIEKNEYLERDIKAFYRVDYVGYNNPNNPDYINILKNTYNSYGKFKLQKAIDELILNLYDELMWIVKTQFPSEAQVAICTVPRAKSKDFYHDHQLLFREAMKVAAEELSSDSELDTIKVFDGTDYITRHTSTKTTHLPPDMPNYDNSGDKPYRGIANDTCTFSNKIAGKHILLIDDVYTKTVNIDEDFIQALLDRGCESVIFFAIARTKRKS